VRSADELLDLAAARAEIDFDPDIYKILQAFIARHPRRIKPLPMPQLEEALL
jgi:hypothetical protein